MTMNRDGVSEHVVRALDNLRVHQRQLDADGVEVGVSREALNEVIRAFGSLVVADRRARAVVTEEMVERAQEAWADAYDAEYFSDGSTKDNKAACMRAALEAALSVRAEPVAVKPLEWRYVWHGSEPNRGSNIYLTDASGLGRGELICNLGTERHEEVRALVDLHNASIRSALVASPSPSIPAGYRLGEHHTIEHDGFAGTVIGHYTRLDGKRGVVMQQDGTNVVHVYGEKWLPAPAQQQEGNEE